MDIYQQSTRRKLLDLKISVGRKLFSPHPLHLTPHDFQGRNIDGRI